MKAACRRVRGDTHTHTLFCFFLIQPLEKNISNIRGKASVSLGIFILLLLSILLLSNTFQNDPLPMVLLPTCRRNETREEKEKNSNKQEF